MSKFVDQLRRIVFGESNVIPFPNSKTPQERADAEHGNVIRWEEYIHSPEGKAMEEHMAELDRVYGKKATVNLGWFVDHDSISSKVYNHGAVLTTHFDPNTGEVIRHEHGDA